MRHLRSLLPSSLVGIVLTVPIAAYTVRAFQRPAPTTTAPTVLFTGVRYERRAFTQPRPQLVHIVQLDLTTAGLKPFVTAAGPGLNPGETRAQTTSQFLQTSGVQLAINANFFSPFREDAPWDYYPHAGDRASVLGTAISNGQPVSPRNQHFPALCFVGLGTNQRAVITDSGFCPSGTQQAVAGIVVLLQEGRFVPPADPGAGAGKAYPMVGVAIDRVGKTLWLLLSDGKQPLYAEGSTDEELAELAKDLGAWRLLKLDGGGSTTLVAEIQGQPRLLNAPTQTKWPMRERPVANHLGFFAQPLQP